jgi:acyl carrier protein
MLDLKTWLLIALIAVGVFASIWVNRAVRKKAELVVGDRRMLSDEEFASQYFDADRRAIAIAARRLLKSYIPVDHRLVQPDDELVRDLQLATIDGLDANHYVRDLRKAFNVSIDDRDAANWRTLRDVVAGVASYLQAGAPK